MGELLAQRKAAAFQMLRRKTNPNIADTGAGRRLRVLIVLTSSSRTSGGGLSFINGLHAALDADPRLDVTAVVPSTFDGAAGVDTSRQVRVRPLTGIMRIVRDLLFCNRWARRSGADVVVLPHEYAPPVRAARVVNVIQNILYLHPEGRSTYPRKSAAMRLIMRTTHRFAFKTFCLSTESAALWTSLTGGSSTILPQGVGEAFGLAAGQLDGRGGRTITVVTGPDHYKHPEIARELATVLRAQHPDWRICIIGTNEEDTGQQPRFFSTIELAAQFRQSHVVVLTSTVESFGLPAFEARACGAHVVVHPATAMAAWLADDQYTHVASAFGTGALVEAIGPVLTASPAPPAEDLGWRSIGPRWVTELISLADINGH